MKLPNTAPSSMLMFWVVFLYSILIGCTHSPTEESAVTPSLTDSPETAVATVMPLSPMPTATPLPVAEPWGSRRLISLNGEWQAVRTTSLDDVIPTSGWEPFQVPGILVGYNYEQAWFQRNFEVPAGWQGQRLILHFNGVKYNSRILVNGKQVGGNFNGYDAFEVDITEAVKWADTNLLQVGVHDWTGVFSSKDFELEPYGGDWEALRVTPADRILSPIGGFFTYYGIWDSVTLKVVPSVHIVSSFIQPSLSNQQLVVDVTVINHEPESFSGSLTGRIFPWYGARRDDSGQWTLQGEPVTALPDVSVTLDAGQTQTFRLTLDNPSLKPWTPYTPNLYVLEIGFVDPNLDAIRERIGWREFQVKGGDFYLNGNKIHLLASSWWPDDQNWTHEQVVSVLQETRAANVIAFRTHTQPWQEIWYETADEVGMLMIPEGAIWNDDISYRINDPRFWKNYANHLTAMVHNLRNHPSVIMWSLENELTGERINDQTPAAEKNLADLGLLVKQLDPTRPITFESDGDPGGIADVIGLHYPNEYPEYRLWPQDGYWLDKPREIFSGGGFFWDNQPFLWDKRKPLYIGEYLWVPSSDPSTHTVLLGDEAYIDYHNYAYQAKAFAWRMQILAYRYFGVSGQSPWTMDEIRPLGESNALWRAVRDMYRPLAAYLHEYDSRFFGGESVSRTILLFNDTMQDLPEVLFRWQLLDGEQLLGEGSETIAMASGAKLEREIELLLPSVSEHSSYTLRLSLSAAGLDEFRDDLPVDVYPRGLASIGSNLAVYDPYQTLASSLTQSGVTVTLLNDLQDWNRKDVLVVAPRALSRPDAISEIPQIGAEDNLSGWLHEQVQAGGRVLVLEQDLDTLPGSLPVKLSVQQSTLAFIQAPNHPIMSGLTHADLRWWRGDYLVSNNETVRPRLAGMHSLVVTGNQAGISHAPLLEVREGAGVWVISQLLVASKLQNEPMAQVLFERIIDYLIAYQSPTGKILYYPPAQNFSTIKLEGEALESWDALAYPAVRLLMIRGSAQDIPLEKVRAYLEAGGRVLWDRPESNANPFLSDIDAQVQVEPWSGTAFRAEGNAPLLNFLTREDLYWIETAGKNFHSESSVAPNASAIFLSELNANATQGAIPAMRGATLEGEVVEVQGSEILLATEGSVTWEVELPQSGLYELILLANGTPAKDIYPLAQIMLDDQTIGTLAIQSQANRPYRLTFNGQAGVHRLKVIFTNDEYAPPEDRNLIVSAYLIQPADEVVGVESLTDPAALVNLPVGKGQLTLSTITWSDEGPNSLRGQRYFAGLLTGLGATYAGGRAPEIVEVESLNPMRNFPLFETYQDYVQMNTNGYVQGEIEVVQAGTYRLGLLGRGTALNGVYPIIQILINGRVVGQIELKGGGWELHSLEVDLPAGRLNLRLSFINDEYSPATGEDRNALLDLVEFELLQPSQP